MPQASSTPRLRALLIEDSDADAAFLVDHLESAGYSLEWARIADLQTLTSRLLGGDWDVVISDFKLQGFTALDALETMQGCAADVPFIVVSAHIDEAAACVAMRAGAQDFLSKDNLDRIAPVIERERRETQMRRERRAALDAVQASESRFHALATNVPGVLFQLRVTAAKTVQFLFLSEATHMLLGMSADELINRENALTNLIVEQDRAGFRYALAQAAERNTTLNWEGRVQPANADVKWINLRCSPRHLGKSGEVLWEGVMWNITQSKMAENELRQSRTQLAELSNHLQHVKEEERDRIARDIHDVLGGTLVGIKISASLLAGKLGEDSALHERIKQIEAMLDEAITVAGRVARELRPGILKEFGLAAAVESYAEDYAQRTGTPCEVLLADYDIETRDDTALALFRTFQEALTNISKHAQASRVEVRLMQEDKDIVLEVSDDGRGMSPPDLVKPKSFGLRSIRERLVSLGGTMVVEAREPRGTRVVLRAPLHGMMGGAK